MSTEGIKEAIAKMSKDGSEAHIVLCTVDSVDLTKNTCTCIPVIEGADLLGVKLMAKNQVGFLIIPKVDSHVIVCVQNNTSYVAMFSEVDEIQLNGDAYGGVIKVDDWLQAYNTQITTLKTAITAALTSIDASIVALGGASVSSPAFTAATATITNVQASTIINNTVKHGDGN